MNTRLKPCFLLLLIGGGLPIALASGVTLQTALEEIAPGDQCARAGKLVFTVTDDSFANASSGEPVYLRLSLTLGAVLGETRVDLGSADGAVNQPIYLPMMLNSLSAALNLAAHPETVSIVRWVRDERELWLRVQTGSDTWLTAAGGGVLFGPDQDASVSWVVGDSARHSWDRYNGPYLDTHANLPAATRQATALTMGDSVSTLLCVNLTDSYMTRHGFDSHLRVYPMAFKADADLGGGAFSAEHARPAGITFTNEFPVALAVERDVSITPFVHLQEGSATEFMPEDASGFQIAENRLSLQLREPQTSDVLQTPFIYGSVIRFRVPDGAPYGFVAEEPPLLVGDNPGAPELFDPFDNRDRTLYRTAEIRWVGGDLDLPTLLSDVALCLHTDDDPDALELRYDVLLVSAATGHDDPPFHGPDQFRRCPPGEVAAISGAWTLCAREQPLYLVENPAALFYGCIGDQITIGLEPSRSDVTYQWRHNGVDIPGADGKTLDVYLSSHDDEGYYTCLVTGPDSAVVSREARLNIETFSLLLDRTGITQGILPVTLRAQAVCGTPPYSFEWRDPTTGAFIGAGRTLTLPGLLTETTTFEVTLTDARGERHRGRVVVIAGGNDEILDPNGDGKNDPADLLFVIQTWQASSQFDVDGDGLITILDLLFINTGER
ncbi:MAG: hypothetical protein QNK37_19945 [Acidobacteriota bacterium]|nr:hypothetical protein [Acidobacteriota bacterium]